MGEISVKLTDEEEGPEAPEKDAEAAKLRDLAEGLPSGHKAAVDALRRSERIVWSFSNIPAPLKAMFKDEAKKRGMLEKEFFYHCLRAGGLDIPSYKDLDARRR